MKNSELIKILKTHTNLEVEIVLPGTGELLEIDRVSNFFDDKVGLVDKIIIFVKKQLLTT